MNGDADDGVEDGAGGADAAAADDDDDPVAAAAAETIESMVAGDGVVG